MSDNQKKSGIGAALKDPLNWALLILASAFAYYVMMIPYWQNYYLKQDPQVMTLPEYMMSQCKLKLSGHRRIRTISP